ncbi:ricin-type beta-trefoil lectin domain protein [Streptomyces sp. NBC_01190]|uniref:ricin-type beta-trefoil lectin domain protein n=1 Tax=Streptomyces sp. NBC_01190 TaxID=2903767 RepID=UPI003864575C|nr:ricin-type beta-trefoil lectin domain protein [Streptomyces sp. NBC_01190]
MTSPSQPDGPESASPPAAPTGSQDEPLPGGPSGSDPEPGHGILAADHSYAAGFARQHYFSGARFLKPGRRVAVAVGGVAAVAAIGVGVATALPHLGGDDHVDAQPAASAKPLGAHATTATDSPTATDGSPGAPKSPVKHPPAKPPAGQGANAPVKAPADALPAIPGAPRQPAVPSATTSATHPSTGKPPAKPSAPSHPITFQGAFVVNFASSRCLASQGGSHSAGTLMVLADCDKSDPSQGWAFASDGTARDFGGTMCLDVASPGNGAALRLAACSAGRAANQSFVLKTSYDLVDVQPDLCVDAKDKNTAAGTVLQTWSCAGTANQKWRMP